MPIASGVLPLVSPWMMGISAVAIVYGAFVAIAQDDIKKLVAYSSVSHMGYVVLGLFALNQIGILPAPDGKIIGLSKYDRIVDYFSSRLQIQEELVKQIERFIVDNTAPRGLAVRISAVHMCKSHRGVRASRASRMVNTAYYGAFGEDPQLKSEFLQECAILERSGG